MPETTSILIVDDRPEKLLALEAILEDLGPKIVRAYSGREALRQVLQQDFAVILLDVNMPDMDGFETAQLIRQRKSSQHTPIIFITAFGDEMHAARGYSLGAVDYILAPVMPDVLRTKVGVFVDLFAKTNQIRRQAESLRRRAEQLQKLAAASVAINGAFSVEKMLQTLTDAARDIVGAHQAITLYVLRPATGARQARTLAFASYSDKYSGWRGRELRLDAVANTLVASSRTATRLTESELHEHPDWEIVRPLINSDLPPIRGGMLAAPLTGRDGTNLGVIYLSDRIDGDFTADDETILLQLAQTGSIALENSLYAEEREANRIKDEFLATLSHELRTPLNAILGWTQLLQMSDRSPDPEDVTHGLEVIERNARSQTKLIEDLLDVSRITTGKLRLHVRPMQVGPVIQAAADAVRPAVDARQIQFSLDAEPELFASVIQGDPDRLQQVFWNLFSNAVKFTDADGTVACRLDVDPATDCLCLKVRDTGNGIDPKFLPHVFDRFRQADSSSTRSHGGLGIGLAVVRHIVELHGGTVRADSAGIGHGSTFTVLLPRTAAAAPATEAGEHRATAAAPPVAAVVDRVWSAAEVPDLSGVRVLVVDDEPDALEVVEEILSRAGAEVTSAASARLALEALASFRPHVLVSDIAMPEEDGYSLIRRVRGLPTDDGGMIPAIAITAYAREEDRHRVLAAGFQAHVAKPVDPAELINTLARWAGVRPKPVEAMRSVG